MGEVPVPGPTDGFDNGGAMTGVGPVPSVCGTLDM